MTDTEEIKTNPEDVIHIENARKKASKGKLRNRTKTKIKKTI